jgi:hypothetical protein
MEVRWKNITKQNFKSVENTILIMRRWLKVMQQKEIYWIMNKKRESEKTLAKAYREKIKRYDDVIWIISWKRYIRKSIEYTPEIEGTINYWKRTGKTEKRI